MKIVIPTFERIEWMPPTITLIKKLVELGHEVVYITLYPDYYFENDSSEKIKNIPLYSKSLCLVEKFPYIKGISGILFRIDTFIKKVIAKRLPVILKREMTPGAVLWVVNEMTVMLAGSSFLKDYNYLFTIYELHERTFGKRHIEKAAQLAKRVIVPEYCRAHIMKSRYRLEKTPLILPNKSDIPNANVELSPSANAAISKMKLLHSQGKQILLYMGGIGEERPLDKVIETLIDQDKYRLALMGRESVYLRDLQKKYPDSFEYLGAFTPPMHLAVARNADVGLLIYVSINQAQGLNALFCAPNKIYEYTGLGLPVITNDIPGLRFEVQMNGIGELVDFDKPEHLVDSLNQILENYEKYQENAEEFYKSINISSIIEEALFDII